jgi:hypothetical protein
MQMRKRKLELQSELEDLEKKIFNLEEKYLRDTQGSGNIIQGWSNFAARRNAYTKAGTSNKVRDEDRMFSNSSTTSAVRGGGGSGGSSLGTGAGAGAGAGGAGAGTGGAGAGAGTGAGSGASGRHRRVMNDSDSD